MADHENEAVVDEYRGPRRRDVLLGATGIAAAVAVTAALSDGVAHAAAGPMSAQISGLGSFEILAFSWGASSSGTAQAGGAGSGRVNIQDVSLTKYVDALSPGLFGALATGQHFQNATITFTSKSGTPVVRLLVEELIITSLSTGGSSGEARLTENVTINFAKVTYSVDAASASYDTSTRT
jgi:type VI secretion system secreted protein Hcp